MVEAGREEEEECDVWGLLIGERDREVEETYGSTKSQI